MTKQLRNTLPCCLSLLCAGSQNRRKENRAPPHRSNPSQQPIHPLSQLMTLKPLLTSTRRESFSTMHAISSGGTIVCCTAAGPFPCFRRSDLAALMHRDKSIITPFTYCLLNFPVCSLFMNNGFFE